MSAISKLVKSALVAGAFAAAAAAGAATLVNHGSPLEFGLSSTGPIASSYTFDYSGGTALFDLIAYDPNDKKSSVKLMQDGVTIFETILDYGTTFSYALIGGTYTLQLSGNGRTNLDSFEISAVPLPGAIWMFGTALLGFLGFSNRRKI